MTPHEFIAKWKPASLSERSACQQHFLDLCALLGQPKPADVDPTGAWYTFEKAVAKTEGGKGFADVWMRGHFGWEYKGKHKDLKDAYRQLLQYREALENPPLLVVCDLNRFEVHTNFTGTAKQVHAFDLDGLADPKNLLVLRNVFSNPEALKPGETRQAITEKVATRFARLAEALARRDVPPHPAAHFLMKLMFCMFAEDIELLPRDLFTRTVANSKKKPAQLTKLLAALFQSMASGEAFGADPIAHFNGGLFTNDDPPIDLLPDEIDELHHAAQADWSSVEPSIFGTLFERSLDPAKRSQIGAHYTSREDIETILRPVFLDPLRRQWQAVRENADNAWAKVAAGAGTAKPRKKDSKARKDFDKIVTDFAHSLHTVTVLDPACGSGNFLYVAINLLLDLEKEVLTYAAEHGLSLFPVVRPTQLLGLEINEYAQQLAQVVIWIGYLQWQYFNGYLGPRDPILDPIDNIRCTDAILDRSDPDNPKEPDWPEADFIVGNPPFLGDKKMRAGLGDDYVDPLRALYGGRIPGQSDLCCYWFEKARAAIESGRCKRAGLLATQGIRGGANRTVVRRIKETGDIFFAESNRPWILDGASVRISMIGFDSGDETRHVLDGKPVPEISETLAANRLASALRLRENESVCFLGHCKGGPFDLSLEAARSFLCLPLNVNGRSNSDVVRAYAKGGSVVDRLQVDWIIDFANMPLEVAARYEAPFEYAVKHVKPVRSGNRDRWLRENWWRPQRMRPEMREAIRQLPTYLVTPEVSKYRIIVFLPAAVLPDHKLHVFARDGCDFFGVLSSRPHDVWSKTMGSLHAGERRTYNGTRCFETFPFPEPTPPQRTAIADAAKELDRFRTNWLNPPEWTREEVLTFRGSVDGPWSRYVTDPDGQGIGTVHYRRLVPKDEEFAKALARRTLTNLYNERPAWLANAHRQLDDAVFAAYGWPASLTDEEILGRLLALNLVACSSQSP